MGEEEARGLLHVTDGNIAGALRMRGEEGTDEDYRLFVAWMRACYANDSVTTVALSDDFAKPGREGMKRFVRYALHMLRQCIVGNYGAQSLVRLTEAERQFAAKFAPFIHHGNVLEMQESGTRTPGHRGQCQRQIGVHGHQRSVEYFAEKGSLNLRIFASMSCNNCRNGADGKPRGCRSNGNCGSAVVVH